MATTVRRPIADRLSELDNTERVVLGVSLELAQ